MCSRVFFGLITAIALIGPQMISAESPARVGDSTPPPVRAADPAIGIIPIGSPMKWGGVNSPDTYSDPTTFGPNPVLVDNGRVRIWQEQVATGSTGEWEIFHMQTVNGGPLAGNINANWNITLDYTLGAAVSFDAVATQWLSNGRPVGPLSNVGSICCAVATNPILPGPAFYNTGFNTPLPAGLQTNWQEIFINPYSFASSGGVPVSSANEITFALHFTLRPAAAPIVTSSITAGAYGAFTSSAPGSWIEIYGTNFTVGSQFWATADFDGVNAPTKLGGVSVSIGGRQAYIYYVSPTQINAQIPSGVGSGPQTVLVTNAAGIGSPFTITVDSLRPGLLAPPSFTVGGTQHVVALFPDNVTYVLPPGAIAGISSRRARPGDTITMYGVGFGPTNPSIPAGQIVQQLNSLATSFGVKFGNTQANVTYQGLAPNFVGLYQFNVVVPSIAASDAVPLTFNLGGVDGTQRLSIAVGN